MKNIFVESVNGYKGLNEAQKGAIISLYRTLFEDGTGSKPAASKEKRDDKKEDKKEDKKDDAKGETKDGGNSEGEQVPFKMTRNRTPMNMQRTDNRNVEYIALHYTAGGSSKPGQATRTQFPPDKKASADFIVDDAEIYQYNPDLDHYYTFAVGATTKDKNDYVQEAQNRGMQDAAKLWGKANYKNTLSIEMCSNYKGGIKDIKTTSAVDPNYYLSEATLANTAKLVAWLLKKYPGAKIVRHYDITGKPCPGPWSRNNEATQQFLSFVQRCHGTPAPADPEYENVDDIMLEKDGQPPWPDFARQFAPDATATTAAEDAASIESLATVGTVSGLVKSLDSPVAKVLAEVIKKNNGKLPNEVIKEFVGVITKKPELLKNVLKILPQK